MKFGEGEDVFIKDDIAVYIGTTAGEIMRFKSKAQACASSKVEGVANKHNELFSRMNNLV
jgi:hypothetical protein